MANKEFGPPIRRPGCPFAIEDTCARAPLVEAKVREPFFCNAFPSGDCRRPLSYQLLEHTSDDTLFEREKLRGSRAGWKKVQKTSC